MKAISRTPAPADDRAHVAFREIARARHSCRAFRDEPVERVVLEQIFDLARAAPSDCNIQPWTAYVATGAILEALRADLYATAARHEPLSPDVPPIQSYSGVHQQRRRECGWGLYGALGIAKGDREGSGRQSLENFRFFGAPSVAIIGVERSVRERGIFDAGIYLAHLLLAAQSLGVATVPQAAVAYYAGVIRRHLPIADHLRILCGVSLGYEDAAHPANAFRTSRAPISETVTFLE